MQEVRPKAKAKAKAPGRPKGRAKSKGAKQATEGENTREDHDGASDEAVGESMEETNTGDDSKGKGTKRPHVPAFVDKPVKKTESDGAMEKIEGVGDEDSAPAAKAAKKEAKSFARRSEPKNPLSNKKWHALREAFNTIIKPYVSHYSAHEAHL